MPWPIDPAWFLLQNFLSSLNSATQPGVVYKLSKGALDPFMQVIDKAIKKDWLKYCAQGTKRNTAGGPSQEAGRDGNMGNWGGDVF